MTNPEKKPLAKRLYPHLPSLWTDSVQAYQGWRHGGGRPATRLDVMTSIGGKDLDVLQVLLQSLSDTHPRDRIEFWLFYLALPQAALDDLAGFVHRLPNLALHAVQVQEQGDFALLSKLGKKPFGARFLWFVAHQYLPEDIDRIIYLDPLDTIVTDDLIPFLRQPLLGKYVAACREAPFAPPVICGPAPRAAARGASAERIFRISRGVLNSGAMVINLKRLRRDRVGIEPYLETAQWAQDQGLTFGDQGLFSLTHGSNYVRAHDRYNFRFHEKLILDQKLKPAVVHFAGRIPKPFHLRLTPEQEKQIVAHLRRTKAKALPVVASQAIRPHHLPYYRQWWQICARTPVHDRIAPVAGAFATQVLAERFSAPKKRPSPSVR